MKYNTVTRTSIASHLGIAGSDILSIESWVYVFYVHIANVGYRFVSKAIVIDRSEMNYYQYDRAILSTQGQMKALGIAIAANMEANIKERAIFAGLSVLSKLDSNLAALYREFNAKY